MAHALDVSESLTFKTTSPKAGVQTENVALLTLSTVQNWGNEEKSRQWVGSILWWINCK